MDLDVEQRRRRILYRATHRGTKEADHLIGGFFAAVIGDLDRTKFDEAERLLNVSDLDLVDWLMGRKPIPLEWRGGLFEQLAVRVRRGPGD
jgi:antitoxin CptB